MAVSRLPLPFRITPAAAFSALFADAAHAFWLDAGDEASQGRSWMGEGDGRRVTVHADGSIDVLDGESVEHRGDDVVAALRDVLRPTARADTGAGFRLGWVGWLGYELGRHTAPVDLAPATTPAAALLHCSRAVEFDHADGTASLLVDTREPGADAWVHRATARLAAAAEAPHPSPAPPAEVRWRQSPERYAELVRRCQDAIRAGDAYQLCLTTQATVEADVDPFETYLRVRAGSPSHHGGYLRFGDTALLSASPEQFLRIDPDGRIVTKPIKGTRPRGATLSADLDLRAELEASDKEQAENLMIVDLMRNDLGRVARLGSVEVTSLLAVESYAHVHQLVSTVEARLADGVEAVDAVAACFPAGSMTGAPKVSAMRILAGLEDGPRGIYSGAFGYFGDDGAVDLAMVIRSIVVTPGRATVGTGGGITALSIPEAEVEETRIKARALLAALGAAETDAHAGTASV